MYPVLDSAAGIMAQAKSSAPAAGTSSITSGPECAGDPQLELGLSLEVVHAQGLKPAAALSEVAAPGHP